MQDLFLDDAATLQHLELSRAERDGTLQLVGSVYDINDGRLKSDFRKRGPRVVTFERILKFNAFPLPQLLKELLGELRNAMGREVEIEFAVNVSKVSSEKPVFNLLQVRPMAVRQGAVDIPEEDFTRERALCVSDNVLGNGESTYCDVIYVDPGAFAPKHTQLMAEEIGRLNRRLREEQRFCVLMGFGRWGSTDPWLGIPVGWEQISQARVMIEADREGFRVDPSSGTHFFQNITAREVGFFSISVHNRQHYLDYDFLTARAPLESGRYVKLVRFAAPLTVKINGKSRQGVILRPKE